MSLPANVGFGRVTGRLIRAILDSPIDPDTEPDGVPIEGAKVTFTASVGRVVNRTATPPVSIFIDPVTVVTNSDGILVSPDGTEGVTLVASDDADLDPSGWTYKVTMTAPSISALSWSITVPEGSVQDLATAIPVPANPGTAVAEWQGAVDAAVAAETEATKQAGIATTAAVRAEQIVADLEGWEPGGGGASSWTEITGKPAVIAAGESVVEARAVIGAVSVEDLPDVSGFATKTELTSGLAGKQAVGDYATTASLATVATTGAYADLTGKPTIPVTPDLSGYATTAALSEGLAGKQPVGDYTLVSQLPDVSGLATKTALTEGLATKQPVGDYATTTALTSGLAGKQPVGDYATRAELPDVSGLATTAYVDQTVGDIDTVLSGILGGE